jgi:hypothetical protein
MQNNPIQDGSASGRGVTAEDKRQITNSEMRLGRRAFMKRVGLGGAALTPVGSLLASRTSARASGTSARLTGGDVAILRFLAAVELIESDLWQQYNELALGNESFQLALNLLDGDEATYVFLNTRDEFTHADFLNKYLLSKGQNAVSLDAFRRLPSSQATGANKSAKRLTNLMNLTVDTSWYNRYRSSLNPDFGASFPQIVDLVNVPGIPNSDLPPPVDADGNLLPSGFEIQFIGNVAGFHFATVEQGGSSLYLSLLPKASSLEVIQIVGAIGGTEIQHFQTWQDKAGNALPVVNPNTGQTLFPQLPLAPPLPNPPNGTDNAGPNDTNQIFATPCEFISKKLPPCSVIRPGSTQLGGAQATVAFFTAMGLFQGQDDGFFNFVSGLAQAADAATRESD